MRPFVESARVEANHSLASGYFLLALRSPRIAAAATPGQFVMVEVQPGHDPLLRRPLSAHRVSASAGDVLDTVELLVKCVGEGTRRLSEIQPGRSLSLIGPLGRGFTLSGPPKRYLVVGGGCGIAPLPFTAERLIAAGHRVEVYYGAASESHLVCRKALGELGAPLRIATDDGSAGHRGPVTDLVRRTLDLPRAQETAIAACGPSPMLRAVKRLAAEYGIPCQVSLETAMACGFGVCLGCSVEAATPGEGYPLACTDGPVFDAERVKL